MLLVTKTVETVGQRASLGLMTTLQGMGIVFAVLICLALLILLVSKVVALCTPKPKTVENKTVTTQVEETKAPEKKEMLVDGVEDEETVAVIMAIVAFNTGSELNSLKFNSIKAID